MIENLAEGCIPPGIAAPASCPCRWLISLDYDGTLRSPEGVPICSEFFSQMQTWRMAGVRWGINTGRDLPYLLADLLPCSPVLPDFLCTCERYVYMAGEDGQLYPAEQHNAECLAANMVLRQHFQPVLHSFLADLRVRHPELVWEIACNDPLSIEAQDSSMMDALTPYLYPLTESCSGVAVQRAGRYLRYSDARFSKGTALKHVLSRWRVKPSHLAVVGDGHNDIGAFRMFPEAFCAAPSTAHPEVVKWLVGHGGYVSQEVGVLPLLRYWYDTYVSGSEGD